MSSGRNEAASPLVETSRTLRLTMFVHVAFSFFCAFTLLSRPDEDLIGAGATVQVPLPLVSQFEMSFRGFLVVGPLVVLAITTYLHAFRRHLETLEPKGKKGKPADEAPFLFNLKEDPLSRNLTWVLFYGLTPAVLALFAWRALPLRYYGLGLFLALVVAAGWPAWRRPAPRGGRRPDGSAGPDPALPPRWEVARKTVFVMLLLSVLGYAFDRALRGWLQRLPPLAVDLYQADLAGLDLRDRRLTHADLREADLRGADLTGAVLDRARLAGADLSRANLEDSELSRADLSGARLETARNLRQRQLDAACGPLPPESWPRDRLPPVPCDLLGAAVRSKIVGWAEDEALNRRLRIGQSEPFLMGSLESEPGSQLHERPRHEVTLSAFHLQEHEVTWREWKRFASKPAPGDDDLPVVGVSWHWATAYAAWLGGSLPTEAQWEYAARAGSTERWSFGDDEGSLGGHAWFADNSGGTVHPVARRLPNAWGLYDLHGNVWEWCRDWDGPYLEGAVSDPTGPDAGDQRVLRGGSAQGKPESLRSACRARAKPDIKGDDWHSDFGFRVAFPDRGDSDPSG